MKPMHIETTKHPPYAWK